MAFPFAAAVGILNRCSTFSVDPESQLQSNRLRWLGHTVRMSADTLPKKLLFKFGQVKGCRPPGRSRLSSMMLHQVTVMNVVASPGDTNILRMLWRDKTCPART